MADWTQQDEQFVRGFCEGADQSFAYIEEIERELKEARKRGPTRLDMEIYRVEAKISREREAEALARVRDLKQKLALAEEQNREYGRIIAGLVALVRVLLRSSAAVMVMTGFRRSFGG